MAVLQRLLCSKLISRKIWMTQKSWFFHTVPMYHRGHLTIAIYTSITRDARTQKQFIAPDQIILQGCQLKKLKKGAELAALLLLFFFFLHGNIPITFSFSISLEIGMCTNLHINKMKTWILNQTHFTWNASTAHNILTNSAFTCNWQMSIEECALLIYCSNYFLMRSLYLATNS